MAQQKWSRLETESDQGPSLRCAGHHVGHRERYSVSGAGVPHVNSLVDWIRTRVAELTAVNPLTPELKVPVKTVKVEFFIVTVLTPKDHLTRNPQSVPEKPNRPSAST